MSFSREWLDLREPLDNAARNAEIKQKVVGFLNAIDNPIITDIACGTGSTQRALSSILPDNTKWHLIDNDPQLLKAAQDMVASDQTTFHQIDLVANLDVIFEIPSSLLTTSAFLDLVSREWLAHFITKLSHHNLPFYGALSYDGRASCVPKLQLDEEIIEAHNLHQQMDKGFGSGLGKDAIALTIKLLEQSNYQVFTGQSDWRDDGKHVDFQKQLLKGWCRSACEINPQRSDRYQQWLSERFSHLENAQALLNVGHIDIFAIPKV